MDPSFVLSELQQRSDYEGQVAVHRTFKEREARYAELERPLPAQLADALRREGIGRLYTHQAQAIDRLRDGLHTIIATGTASGKTMSYHLPVFEALLDGRVALYLSPTKALAQDQLRQIDKLRLAEVRPDTYDGDTPASARAAIRRRSNLVLTNPDMLHIGILPYHHLWKTFFQRLAFVIVDEAHVLRGVFGSHAALILRRLRRIAKRYGREPTFALASATIGNPAQHATLLTGLETEAVTDDGSPVGERHLAFWNPPFLADSDDGRRRSSNVEAAKLLAELVRDEARTLAFSKTRVSAELVARYAKRFVDARDAGGIVAYRAGYLASERREVEQGLQDGRYPGVSATNALELGIDVGGLDAVLLNGFPGTVASARQQMGRAGRSGMPSLAVVVPQDEPLDQYYVAHPNDFFAKPHEVALVNPTNPHILGPHVGCAAYEVPLSVDTESDVIGGHALDEIAQQMLDAGVLRERRGRLYWARPHPPAPDVDIRSAGGAPFRIVEGPTGRIVGTVDAARAHATVHPGAVYLHQGDTYRVSQLVETDRVALVESYDEEEYTQAKTDTDVVVLETERESTLGSCGLFHGLVEVTEQVVAYARRRLPGGEIVETHPLDLPPQRLVTRAVWYTIPESLLYPALAGLEGEMVMLGALHAAEHAGIGILPVFAMCDRWDIGGLSTNFHPHTDRPTIFIYDGYPMGAGISDHGFDVARDHLRATRDHVERCPCASGCPSCVQSPKCGNWNEPLHKQGAIRVLNLLLATRDAH
jgi:DEAD/DEAH box helicase domain-containing protein